MTFSTFIHDSKLEIYVSIIIEFNMALRTADHAREWCEIRGDFATLAQKICDHVIHKVSVIQVVIFKSGLKLGI